MQASGKVEERDSVRREGSERGGDEREERRGKERKMKGWEGNGKDKRERE